MVTRRPVRRVPVKPTVLLAKLDIIVASDGPADRIDDLVRELATGHDGEVGR